ICPAASRACGSASSRHRPSHLAHFPSARRRRTGRRAGTSRHAGPGSHRLDKYRAPPEMFRSHRMGEPEPTTPAGHVPVLLDRVLELLAPALGRAGAVLVDATLGLGGPSEAPLRGPPEITLVGLDRDREALRLSAQRLADHAQRIHLVHAVYDQLPRVLAELDLTRIDAALFDLGV